MSSAFGLRCPVCKRYVRSESWHNDHEGCCAGCHTDFDFYGFPALSASAARVQPKAVVLAEHATCYYHAENQAEAVCDGCGRFVCAVCAIGFGDRQLCPTCMANAQATDARALPSRTLFDRIALGLAVMPVLIWPITLVTAPLALGAVIFGWRRPGSLLRRSRWRFVVAAIVAAIEIALWGTFFFRRWLR